MCTECPDIRDLYHTHTRRRSYNRPLMRNSESRATSVLRYYFSPTSPVGLCLAGCSSTSCRHSSWQGAPTFSPHTFGMSKSFDWNPQSAFCTNRLLSSPSHAPVESGTELATRKSPSAETVWCPRQGSMTGYRFCRRGEWNCGCRRLVPPKCLTRACPSIRSRICCQRLRHTGRWRRSSIRSPFP